MQSNCAMSRLKVLVALRDGREASVLQQELESLGHRVELCRALTEACRWLQEWQPDLLVTEEELGRQEPDAGVRLAEYCRTAEDRINGWLGTRALILIPSPDCTRFQRARQTGAHVIVKGSNFDAVIRYIQTVADNLITDRLLGPALVGIHRFRGSSPHPNCDYCEWVGARVSYGSSYSDLESLTPVRTALLNILLFRRRGQSPTAIVDLSRTCPFFREILRKRVLRESAIKMEVTRLRHEIRKALEAIGAPYRGEDFLPLVPYGVESYSLAGSRGIVHIPKYHEPIHLSVVEIERGSPTRAS